MSPGAWARWMHLLERGETLDKPAQSVSAYIIKDDAAWDDVERQARIDTLKKFLRSEHKDTDHWVIFEHTDGRHEVVWPGD
jgi:predicted acetyltransferase